MLPEMIRANGIFDERFTARFLRKFLERAHGQVGYRDNMMLVFILSTQMSLDCARNPVQTILDDKWRTIDIVE
jgi:asparagine synthase (glutamine-hydrolysing)